MQGERNLDQLLKTMKPVLHAGKYVFYTIKHIESIEFDQIILFFKEEEGYTVVVTKELADRLGFVYTFVSSWITLTVHSSLEAVGLTAAFSNALAQHSISCNVVAGYFHDHIFVDYRDAEKAMSVLTALSEK